MKRWLVLLCVCTVAHAAVAQDTTALRLGLALEEGAHAGRVAPAMVLPYATADSAGPANQPFDLRKELGRVVVLMFYGGHAAPSSLEEWRAVVSHEQRLVAGGITVAGISSDPIAVQVQFARQVPLPFKLLSDRSRLVARRYGLPRNSSAAWLVVVVGRDGRVRYVDSRFTPRNAASYVDLDSAIQAATEAR